MERVRFAFAIGMYPMGMPKADWIYRLGDCAEEEGLDAIAMGDHISFTSPNIDSLTQLAAFAGRTKRIGLMTSVLITPLRNPAVLAKVVASIDYLSDGRMILGLGVGGENPPEFQLCGIPLSERGSRTDETIEILRKLWRDSPASHHGRFWHFDDMSIDPKPIQSGGPPIWIGGRSDKALERAVRLGDGWLAYAMGPERFATSVQKIKEYAAADGRDLDGFLLGHCPFIYCLPDREAARETAIRYLVTVYNQPSFAQLADKLCIMGNPDDCIRQIERYVQHGARFMALRSTCPPDQLMDQIKIYAREIMPHFQKIA